MKFDIKTLTEEAISAFRICMEQIAAGKREVALVQYGRGVALESVLSMLVGCVHDFNPDVTRMKDKAWIAIYRRCE